MCAESYKEHSSEGAKAVLDRMVKILGNPPGSYAMALDVNPNTIKTWIRRGEVSMKYIQGFAEKYGVSVDYVLRGVEAESAMSGVHYETTGDSRNELPPAKEGGGVYLTGAADAVPIIDIAVLVRCLEACSLVHGERFAAFPATVQIEYAADLYNMSVKMSAQGGGFERIKRLDATGLQKLLEAFMRLGWAKKFPPPPTMSDRFF
jgi:hypothetical protein